jgi:hypothetical protein
MNWFRKKKDDNLQLGGNLTDRNRTLNKLQTKGFIIRDLKSIIEELNNREHDPEDDDMVQSAIAHISTAINKVSKLKF